MATPAQAPMTPAAVTAEPVPVAFVGRTSTLALQDPRASLNRQLRSARDWLPPGGSSPPIYWDIESGGIDLEHRSQGDAYKEFADTGPAPRRRHGRPARAKPHPPPRNSPPWSARTSSAPAATCSTR